MKVRTFVSGLAQKLRRKMGVTAGVAVLAGGMMFAGDAGAQTIISEDFEAASPGSSGWVFAQYGTGANYSASPHSGVPGGGDSYGWNPDSNANGDAADVSASTAVDLTVGHKVIKFDGWLASYTANDDYARFEAEFFDDLGGAGTSLGTVVLADGTLLTAADGVTESVDSTGLIIAGDAGANRHNWKHYVTTNSISAGALSVVINYHGDHEGVNNGNDAYADNINITTAIPEPASLALLGLGGLALAGMRRRK